VFLVVDANILFEFFKPESAERRLINSLSYSGYRLISPDFALKELVQMRGKIMNSAPIDELDFMFLLSLIVKKVEIISKSEYEKSVFKAIDILGKHVKDVPYFAVALAFNCPIWSNEKRLKKQPEVEVLNTPELSA